MWYELDQIGSHFEQKRLSVTYTSTEKPIWSKQAWVMSFRSWLAQRNFNTSKIDHWQIQEEDKSAMHFQKMPSDQLNHSSLNIFVTGLKSLLSDQTKMVGRKPGIWKTGHNTSWSTFSDHLHSEHLFMQWKRRTVHLQTVWMRLSSFVWRWVVPSLTIQTDINSWWWILFKNHLSSCIEP